jgi:hypothetical protein
MSTAFLCVQFRNLLPSEQLVLLARALWSDMLQAGARVAPGDAILSITQLRGPSPAFEAELSLPHVPRRGVERDADALVAIDKAFARWNDLVVSEVVGEALDDASRAGQTAPALCGG